MTARISGSQAAAAMIIVKLTLTMKNPEKAKATPASSAASGTEAQHAREDVHRRAGQADLEPGEDPVGAPQGQDVEQDAERIERRLLPGGEEGRRRQRGVGSRARRRAARPAAPRR